LKSIKRSLLNFVISLRRTIIEKIEKICIIKLSIRNSDSYMSLRILKSPNIIILTAKQNNKMRGTYEL